MCSTGICDVNDHVKETIKKFRFKKDKSSSALILKVDKGRQEICVDEEIDNIDIDELREQLPSHQPRYIIYSCKIEHTDGRISYPLCFIFYSPRDSQMELQMMYAGSKTALQNQLNLTKVYEIRELEDLTQEWLKQKLIK